MAIKRNENTADRFARIVLGGACILFASYSPELPSGAVLVLLILGLYLIFSGLSGRCLIYKMLGIKTT